MFPALIQGGAYDQRGREDLWVCCDTAPLASRPDVLVFHTEPLESDFELAGPITVHLFVSSSGTDTDFTAKLIDVHPPSPDWPEGFDSIVRCRYRADPAHETWLVPGEVVEITIEPQSVANLFAKGHRLRLDVSSSNFPRFDVNPNTGEPCGRESGLEVVSNAVFVDASRPSRVALAVRLRAPDSPAEPHFPAFS
jgi:putative CocE/NonD family hydrolase